MRIQLKNFCDIENQHDRIYEKNTENLAIIC